MRPELFLPGHTFHTSRLLPGGRYCLLSTTEWPAVDPVDVELATPAQLVARYPDFAEQIRDFHTDRDRSD